MLQICCVSIVDWTESRAQSQQHSATQNSLSNYLAINHLTDHCNYCTAWTNASVGKPEAARHGTTRVALGSGCLGKQKPYI